MKLFKKDSKGKIRSLEIYAEDNQIVQISGLLEGKKVTRRSTCVAKNVGRSNETTAAMQAYQEAEKKVIKKQKEGYFLTIDEAQNSEVILPMLANSYKDHGHKIDFNNMVITQPKYDGMRCLAVIRKGTVRLMSRSGNQIENMMHIENELSGQLITSTSVDMILDGELYVHGENFQTNMKYIKKYRPGKTERIKFYMYDMVSHMSFYERYIELLSITKFTTLNDPNSNIKLTKNNLVHNIQDVKDNHKAYLADGYEGSIIRWGEDPYTFDKRSDTILKYKDFLDKASKIIDIVASEKNPELGVIHCEDELGNTFGCGMKFSNEEKKEMLTNKHKYIGKTAELRFFEYSESGIPRFPVCVGIRLDK